MKKNCELRIADCGSPARRTVFVLLLLLVIIIGPRGVAQVITLKSGQKIETLGVRRDGEVVMGKVQVGTGSGEVGYQVAQIAKIDFPEPRGVKMATDLMAQRQPDKALAEIEPVIAYYSAFKEVPGSFWSQAALIKVAVLAALKRDGEADNLANEIEKAVTDPEVARAVRVRLSAGLIRKKDFDKAIAICDAAIKESLEPEVLANAWLNKGDALAGKKEWDAALLSYLRVPIFYQDVKTLLPPALLGSARAYWRLEDAARAKKAFNDLIAAYPQSPEAAIAQTELQKIQTP
jgi:tetratricopeptide (TPR) repeat protein